MPSLLTASQARWVLQIILVLLSAIAIASSAPPAAGGEDMYSGLPGDVRGLTVVFGAVELAGVVLIRGVWMLCPKPWRIYVDRVEFDFVALSWICWTSATMAFSAFTLSKGVCSTILYEHILPSCPLLTWDLTLLHLISTVTLALMLVILSTALSPGYAMSLSSAGEEAGQGSAARGEGGDDGFVMWELALASGPGTPLEGPISTGYGSMAVGDGGIVGAGASVPVPVVQGVIRRKDKFAEGRIWSYIPLGICSVGASAAAGIVMEGARFRISSGFVIAVGLASLAFATGFLVLQRTQRYSKIDSDTPFLLRHDRALEVAFAGALYLIWPLTAILYTLFPPTPNRPCANPASSVAPGTLPQDESGWICILSSTTVTLAWMASWIILVRLMGLVVPLPEMDRIPRLVESGRTGREGDGEEGRSLLRSADRSTLRNEDRSNGKGERPQVKWGRMVAGEAFELGGEDD